MEFRLPDGWSRAVHVGAVLLCLPFVLLAGCEQNRSLPITSLDVPPDLQQYITGSAAQGLNAQGEFQLSGASASSDIPTISREKAAELAIAFVRTWGQYYKNVWAEEHGATTDLENLQAHPRIFYAETPYGRFPDGYHPAFRRAFGPWYLVTLMSHGEPVLLVAVSAYNTDLNVDGRGKLVYPVLTGNDFEAWGIGASPAGLHPVGPEEAVEYVGRRTGARIARTPDLLLLDVTQHPGKALWKLSLDRGVRVRSVRGNRRVDARDLYVGPKHQLFTADSADSFSAVYNATAIRYTPQGERLGPAAVSVPIKTSVPIHFSEVVLEDAP